MVTGLAERILRLVQWRAGVTLMALIAAAWLFDLYVRRQQSEARKRLMAAELLKLRQASVASGVAWLSFAGLRLLFGGHGLVAVCGFVLLLIWLVTLLRLGRVFVFDWLFALSVRAGVPALLVDLFTLVASLLAFGVLLHEVFLIEVTSLLATSAVASVVLGLAMQDTLGHLFAGISLQLDRPFRIGDWIEVRFGGDKISGQVQEISWRATSLVSLTEELITIPNKSVAQGLVSNFAARERPFVRSHWFRLPLGVPLERAKALLLEAALATDGIRHDPLPMPLVIENTESWIAIKVVTFVDDYGRQFVIGDEFQSRALELLAQNGITLASARLLVTREAVSANLSVAA